jgi:hypothetical protein
MMPSLEAIHRDVRRLKQFALVIDVPAGVGAGRHVFIHATRDGLLADATAWMTEVRGPNTDLNVDRLRIEVSKLKAPWARAVVFRPVVQGGRA